MSTQHNLRQVAEEYVRSCLAIMDGTTEAGIRRIGTSEFEDTVNKIIKAVPRKLCPECGHNDIGDGNGNCAVKDCLCTYERFVTRATIT